MRKRLLLSLMTVAVVLAAFTYAAFAYFKTTTSGTVSVTSGTPALKVEYSRRCSAGYVDVTSDLSTTWGSIVPGDEIQDCIRITNDGDGALDVYVHNSDFHGGLRAALNFRVQKGDESQVLCTYQVPDSAQYTTANSDRGCLIVDELAPDGIFVVKVGSKFVDDNTDQSSLEGLNTYWTTTLDGYTD